MKLEVHVLFRFTKYIHYNLLAYFNIFRATFLITNMLRSKLHLKTEREHKVFGRDNEKTHE